MKMTSCGIAIVGGGPGGISAAIWCKRLGADHLLFDAGKQVGGALAAIHNPLIDYPGLPAGSGRDVQEAFAAHLAQLQCRVRTEARVAAIDVAGMRIALEDGSSVAARSVIVATGCSDKRLGVPGEREMIERGEVYSAARDKSRFRGQSVAVVGGGDRAAEGALLLAEAGAEVVWIHRSDRFRAREELLQPALRHPRIELLPHAAVREIRGDSRIAGVRVALADGSVRDIAVSALFVRIGVEPNSRLVRGQVDVDEDGYIRTDAAFRTSDERVYAVGDVCTRPMFASVAAAVGQGMIAAKQAAMRLEGRWP